MTFNKSTITALAISSLVTFTLGYLTGKWTNIDTNSAKKVRPPLPKEDLSPLTSKTTRKKSAQRTVQRPPRPASFMKSNASIDSTIVLFEKSMTKDPKNKQVRLQLISYLINQGRFERAEKEIAILEAEGGLSEDMLRGLKHQKEKLHFKKKHVKKP